jgi:ATP-dependent exoDNAse (exonuclease V) beta subunit
MRMPSDRFQANKASAGSGKTFRLTSVYLRDFLRGAAPESILATTFTRKAAGEVLERVLKRLADATQSDEAATKLGLEIDAPLNSADEAKRHMRRLARSLHRVQVMTIDSFFGRLLKAHRYECSLPLNASLTDEDGLLAKELRIQAIQKLLDHVAARKIENLLAYQDPGEASSQVIESIDQLVDSAYSVFLSAPREAWFRIQTSERRDSNETARMEPMLRRCLLEYPKFEKPLAALLDSVCNENWQEVLEQTIVKNVMIGRCKYGKTELPSDVVAIIEAAADCAKNVTLIQLKNRTEAVYRLLAAYDQIYSSLKYRRGVMYFSDVPRALRQIFESEDFDPVSGLDAPIEHLLLDEFQDTSADQWQILRPFAKRIEAGGADGSLFVVGDVKQAIYGWRGGSAKIFDEMLRDISGVKCQPSDTSWRSSQIVLDVVNRVFDGIREGRNGAFTSELASGAAVDWAREFSRHTQAMENAKIPGFVEYIETNTETSDAPSGDGDEGEPAPADHIEFCARYIADIANRSKSSQSSIGVLVARNSMVAPLMLALGRQGVRASAESASQIADDPGVSVILSALRLADHPGDTAASFHVRHSPLADLLLSSASNVLASEKIRADLLRRGYSEVIGKWSKHLASFSDDLGARRLDQLNELAEKYGSDAGLRPSKFVKIVLDQTLEDPSPGMVRVMTIHKSKGLEFDSVILPEIHTRIVRVAKPLALVDQPSPTEPIRGVYCFVKSSHRALDPRISEAMDRAETAEIVEALCRLYVAMTRARHALHMITPKPHIKKDGTLSSTLTFASILRGELLGEEQTANNLGGATRLFWTGERDWLASIPPKARDEGQPVKSATKDSRFPIVGRQIIKRILPSKAENAGYVSAAKILEIEDNDQANIGTAIHSLFEMIEWNAAAQNRAAIVAVLSQKYSHKGETWIEDRVDEFLPMLAHPEISAVFERPSGELDLWRERRFSVLTADRLIEGVFDRVSIEKLNGVAVSAVIYDFKTTEKNQEDLAFDLNAKIRQYKPQLDLYREALGAMLHIEKKRITCKLVFASQKQTIEC